jgi:deazaflavin-dependent oxidoreductase (nitroreductase family)
MPNEFNERIIKEFRANAGKVGPPFEGAPMVLLTTTGARSGKPHATPLVPYIDDDGAIYVIASMGGAPKHPAWYFNLVANPAVTVEHGTEKFEARAEPLERDERERIFAKQAEKLPAFGDYQRRTTRIIPVIKLAR